MTARSGAPRSGAPPGKSAAPVVSGSGGVEAAAGGIDAFTIADSTVAVTP
jgi:hypothetical protein